MNKNCPNCGKEGNCQYDAVANSLGVDEWNCHNENCRVSLYYVEPPENTEEPRGED